MPWPHDVHRGSSTKRTDHDSAPLLQVCHHAIGGYATAWEAGTAVTAHLVRMAAIILSEAEREKGDAANAGAAPAAGDGDEATQVDAAPAPCAQ